MNSKFENGPPLLYTDCAKMEFGDFRRLAPPNPGYYNIFKTPPMVPTVTI